MTPEISKVVDEKVKKSPRGAPITDPVVEAASDAPDVRPCALDDLPVGSKLVVVRNNEGRRIPVFATSEGEVSVPPRDLAGLVPEGTRIVKEGPSRYVATLIGIELHKPPLVTATARAALEQFNSYFG